VHGELAAEVLIAACGLDGVDVAYEVGYGDVGGGEFFDEAVVGGKPRYRRVFPEAGDEVAGELGDGGVGVVAGFSTGYVRHCGVEQCGERAEDAGLRLATEAEEDEVVFAEDRVDDLGNDRVLVADDAGEQGLLGAELGDQVIAELVLYAAREALGGEFAGAESA
jgi:hypothetical protein